MRSNRRRLAALVAATLLVVIGPIAGPSPILGAPGENGFPTVRAPRFLDVGAGHVGPLWGRVDCGQAGRVTRKANGGDPSLRPDGRVQGGGGYRRLRVLDGDDVSGERCELGLNDWRTSPVALYHEGDHLITFASLRLGPRFPLDGTAWQTVMQMKQSQPSAAGGGAPILELDARDGKWRLVSNWKGLWSVPAARDVWTRIAFDVRYSQDPALGTIKVYIDRNGDGDVLDRKERSPTFHLATLRRETVSGLPTDGILPGASIPSHLRIGVYHDPSYMCEGFRCSIGVDDVGVFEPAP